MKRNMVYYVIFEKNNKPVCGTWVDGTDKEDAMTNAAFKLECRFPNVEYDNTYVAKESE